jgi:hypothetical protein
MRPLEIGGVDLRQLSLLGDRLDDGGQMRAGCGQPGNGIGGVSARQPINAKRDWRWLGIDFYGLDADIRTIGVPAECRSSVDDASRTAINKTPHTEPGRQGQGNPLC